MTTGYAKTDSGDPLADVQVCNGLDVGRTDQDGRYELPDHRISRFIFISTPSGYTPTRRFYIDLHHETARDFILKADPQSVADEFSFVQITDLHLSTERRYLPEGLAADLAQIRDDVGDKARFLIASGDLTAGGKTEEYAAYLQTISATEWPFYHAAGNHDGDTEVQGIHFMDYLGPLYYSFDYGPIHFVVYDGESHLRDGSPSTARPFTYVPSPQDTWLRADLAAQDPARPIIFVNHFPWGDEFYAQWTAYPIVATLSGHWHSTRMHRDDKTTHYNTPSLGFGGIDQSPRGYRYCTWSQGQLHSETRALVAPSVFSGISFRPHPDNAAGQVEHYANNSSESLLQPLWQAGTGGSIHTAAPVVAEGCVFQAIKNEAQRTGNGLVALDAHDGALQWTHDTDAAIKNTPAYADQHLFAATVTGQILTLTSAGDLLWSYQLNNPSQRWRYSSPLAHAGRLYAGVSSHLVAFDLARGARIWQRADLGPDDWISSYPSPAAHGGYLAVAFYTQPTSLTVLDANNGTTLWQQDGDKAHYIYATPIIGPDGTLYAVSGSAVRAYGLESGKLLWQSSLSLQRVQSAPTLDDGRLFVATGTGTLHAFDANDGAEIWRWSIESQAPLFTPYIRRGPTTLGAPIVAAGRVFIGGADGYVYVLDATTGECIETCDLGMPLAANPAVVGEQLYIGGCDGFVYAFAIGS